jgi:integrase/recombinase XerD
VDLVAPFVAGRVRGERLPLEDLGAGDVSEFMLARAGRFSPKTMQRLASALRSLLRFWHLKGDLATSLVGTVPKVAYRCAGLPRGLAPEQVSAMLASCTPERSGGLRDYAMLLLLSRLGLRCGDVAALQLDDVDWRSGQFTVRGKGNRTDVLPLPVDVGQAMAAYLCSGRPPTASGRSVFVRIKAPHRELTAGGVTQAVAAAAQRAGLGVVYGHRLRHSAATSMQAAGGPAGAPACGLDAGSGDRQAGREAVDADSVVLLLVDAKTAGALLRGPGVHQVALCDEVIQRHTVAARGLHQVDV